MKQSLKQVTTVALPRSVIIATHAHLAAAGRRGLEGIVLWTGVQNGDRFEIADCVIPQQTGVRSDHGLAVTVAPDELRRISLDLFKRNLRLLAQVHSHPTDAYHSAMDDEYAIATALGAFSLVVPDFAVRPFSVADCAVYRLSQPSWWQGGGPPRWIKVPRAQALRTFKLEGD